MSDTVAIRISILGGPKAEFFCHEPDDAWCQRNVVGAGEEPPEIPSGCWFTILADGLASFGRGGNYDGPPTELRSDVVEFTRTDGYDYCHWHYVGDTGGHDYYNVTEANQ